MNKLALYVHIPFCVQKCRYCDFYSMAGGGREVFLAYKDALKRHFAAASVDAAGYLVDSVYFGGGTPSLLPAEILCELMQSIRTHFHLTDDCEITLEMNPRTSDEAAMKKYLEAGFNRLSIGCQSADDNELRLLGRIHSFQDFCKTVEDARAAGFANISADLMMALPGQTEESLLRSIDRIAALEPNHISVYGLKIEKGTWFDHHKDELVLHDEDSESSLYLTTVARLQKHGYFQYEISNFSKKGFESRHNLKYWNAMPYLGFGPAAYSYFEGYRYGYKRDFNEYLKATQTLDFGSLKQDEEFLTEKDVQEEKLLLGLRLNKGVVLSDFSFHNSVDKYIETLCVNEFAKYAKGRLSLSPKGMLLDNLITSELLLHLIDE